MAIRPMEENMENIDILSQIVGDSYRLSKEEIDCMIKLIMASLNEEGENAGN